MKNIEPLYLQYRELFAQQSFKKKFDFLGEVEQRQCSTMAKVWAYKKSIIPQGFDDFNIFDFTGYGRDGSFLLDNDTLVNAKNTICRYCWGVPWSKDLEKMEGDPVQASSFFAEHRKMLLLRRKHGNHIIIHGNLTGKKGRTFIASLIMKEAILLKTRVPDPSYTYDWIDFTQLKEEAQKDNYEFAVYRSCDWLVVDNITRNQGSSAQRSFWIGYWNNFFIDRHEANLPTILVLKFSLDDETFDPDGEFGSGFSKIIQSERSTLISLSKAVDDNVKE